MNKTNTAIPLPRGSALILSHTKIKVSSAFTLRFNGPIGRERQPVKEAQQAGDTCSLFTVVKALPAGRWFVGHLLIRTVAKCANVSYYSRSYTMTFLITITDSQRIRSVYGQCLSVCSIIGTGSIFNCLNAVWIPTASAFTYYRSDLHLRVTPTLVIKPSL